MVDGLLGIVLVVVVVVMVIVVVVVEIKVILVDIFVVVGTLIARVVEVVGEFEETEVVVDGVVVCTGLVENDVLNGLKLYPDFFKTGFAIDSIFALLKLRSSSLSEIIIE